LKGYALFGFFFCFVIDLGWEKEFSVLSWHKNVGYDCRDMANNKDGHIASAVCASYTSGSRV